MSFVLLPFRGSKLTYVLSAILGVTTGLVTRWETFGETSAYINTGDKVEVDGEYFRILGRQSEFINVGGQKVYPAEVERVLQEMPEIAEVSVYGEKNAIVGEIVCAAVRLREPRDARDFQRDLR